MINEEIVKNAPDWATHWAVNNKRPFDSEYAALCENDVYRDLRDARFNNDKWTFTPLDELKTTESVYTQEMKDNGEPVKVGMKFKRPDEEGVFEAALISKRSLSYIDDMDYIRTISPNVALPIKSEREEAEEALIKKVVKVLRVPTEPCDAHWHYHMAKKLLEAGLLAEIILPLKRS